MAEARLEMQVAGPLRIGRWHIVASAMVALVALAALVTALAGGWSWSGNSAEVREREMLDQLVHSTVVEEDKVLNRGLDAVEQNSLIPLSKVALEVPASFRSIDNGTPQYATALNCLTQAIYYEAANEPLAGKRGVAQVVLNRVRHPAYPNSVCGVVYQDANRAVCQFSFVCDGSLLRTPLRAQWEQSREVAKAALAGFVEKSVGSATHYHADYVVPKWAYTLDKLQQQGRHIFYRFPGKWGEASYLSARWSGREAIPTVDFGRLRQDLAALEAEEPVIEFVPGLTVVPDVADRHAADDVGGRIDTTKEWRPNIPDPVEASRTYRNTLQGQASGDRELASTL
ncbi:MAG TPA: cell wall hydrolase [Sphingomonadaceae bacterium]|nr:cell wall hydrolase [Sphingomonadaceae bacterium]